MDWQTLVARRAKKDPLDAGRLERLLHLVGLARHPRPGVDRLPQRRVRQGDVRLAVRRGASRSCATPSPRRPTRPSRRRSPSRSQVRVGRLSDLRAARPVHHADGDPQQHHRPALPCPSWRCGTSRRSESRRERQRHGLRRLDPGALRPLPRPAAVRALCAPTRREARRSAAGARARDRGRHRHRHAALAERLPAPVDIVATDLNQADARSRCEPSRRWRASSSGRPMRCSCRSPTPASTPWSASSA